LVSGCLSIKDNVACDIRQSLDKISFRMRRMEPKTSKQVQLLLESIVVMLNNIQESYDEFLTIEQTIQLGAFR